MKKSDWLVVLATVLIVSASFAYQIVHQAGVIHDLCHAERGFIARQEEQTRRLLARGNTFGIPKAELPALIQRSRESQEGFLRDLHCS